LLFVLGDIVRRNLAVEQRQLAGLSPVDDLHPAIQMLDQSRAAFHPVAIVGIGDLAELPQLGMMDMAADHPFDATLAGDFGHGLFEIGDILNGVLDPMLQVSRQRPVGIAHLAPRPVEPVVQGQRQGIGLISQMGQPLGVLHHAVELVAMHDQVASPVQAGMNGLVQYLDVAELKIRVIAGEFVVVSRHIDDPGALARFTQQFLHHVVMGLGPIPRPLQPPAVDHVADQIEIFGFRVFQEIQQKIGLAAAGSKMDV